MASTTRLHRDEWRLLASLANVKGYEAGWKASQKFRTRAPAQDTIKRAALAELRKSKLVGQHVGDSQMSEVWIRNYYRGYRLAQEGQPEGLVYPGMIFFR